MTGPFAPRPGFEPAPVPEPGPVAEAPAPTFEAAPAHVPSVGSEPIEAYGAPTAVHPAIAVATPIDPFVALPQRGGRLLAASFDLLTGARGDLRRASLYIGLILLLTAGPFALLALGLVASGNPLLDSTSGSDFAFGQDPASAGLIAPFGVAVYVAIGGYLVAAVEGQAIAIVLLGGRLAGRRITLRAAVTRSRVVFWRLIRGGIIVQVPLLIVQLVVTALLTPSREATSQGAGLLATGIVTILGLPFAYLATGIVLGDVGALESVRRSIRIVRTRIGTAFVVALFAAVAQYLLILGLGVGGDILARVATPLELDPSGGAGSVLLLGGLVLVFVTAFGTLLFTVSAIEVAPQVVAFLALTRYTGGLDKAVVPASPVPPPLQAPEPQPTASEPVQPLEPAAAAAPPTYWVVTPRPAARFRWLTRPLLVGAGLGILATAIGLIQLAND
jgi:hypothetical protein